MKRKMLIAASAIIGVLAACAELFDEPSQCQSDRDCTKFGGVCDVTRAVCVPPPAVPGGEGGGPTDDGAVADAEDEAPPPPPGCDVAVKDTAEIVSAPDAAGDSEIGANVTLDCTKDWILKDRTFVKPGVTVTIQPGTRILALANAGLVVARGAKLEAKGFRDQPIVFTASGTAPTVGFWRGLYLLGQAPPNAGASYTGVLTATYPYGGMTATDSSGTLEYVRVEYAGDGLVLAGVGSGTKVDHVQVRRAGATTCFAIAGGRVDAKHLFCQYPADEMIEISGGYDGRIQYFYGQKAATGGGHNGLLSDGNSFPKVYNATFCGEAQNNTSYGFLFRNNTRFDIGNAIFTGWGGGFDYVITGATTPGSPITIRNSIFGDNTTNPAFIETEAGTGDTLDDDLGFDEIAFLGDGGTNNTNSPGLVACHNGTNPQPWPNATITGTNPPNDGFFDTTANYVGAFKDSNDNWLKGAWVKLTDP